MKERLKGAITRKSGTLLTLALIVSACNQQHGFSGGKNKSVEAQKPTDSRSKTPTDAPTVDQLSAKERVDIPQNIAGAHLVCAERKAATEADLSSDVGCRLNETGTDRKLEIDSFQDRIIWTSNVPKNIEINTNSPVPAWHAIYTIKGLSLDEIRETASYLRIQTQWSDPTAESPGFFQDQAIQDVLQPIASTDDDTAPILQQGIDPSDPGIF